MYDEVESVEALVAAVRGELELLGRSWELVAVDDGSTDGTPEALGAEAALDPRVVPVLLSRNFGKEAALSAGLDAARGRAVVLMDADLQHPPEVISELVARWDEGFEVVDAVRESRGGDGLMYGLFARIFYRLMGPGLRRDLRRQSDFKLLDRQVVEAVRAAPERARFFRGLVAWVGFRVAEVPFTVAPRLHGRTKWSTRGLVAYAVRNLLAFSSVPLLAISWLGFLTTAAAALLGVQTLWNYLRGAAVDGFTTTILSVLGMGGAILVCLGVVAAYLAVIYEEIKARPLYLTRAPRPLPGDGDGSSPPKP